MAAGILRPSVDRRQGRAGCRTPPRADREHVPEDRRLPSWAGHAGAGGERPHRRGDSSTCAERPTWRCHRPSRDGWARQGHLPLMW